MDGDGAVVDRHVADDLVEAHVALAEGVGRRLRVAQLRARVGDAEQRGVAVDGRAGHVPAVAFDETPSFFALTVPVTVDAAAVAGADTMRTPWASWAKRSFAACWVDAADAAEASTAEATITGTTRRSMRMRAYLLDRGVVGT